MQSGAAQAAFLPLSLASVPPLSEQGRTWLVPSDVYPRVEQAGVVIKGSKQPALARELAAFMLGDEARGVLVRYGYSASREVKKHHRRWHRLASGKKNPASGTTETGRCW